MHRFFSFVMLYMIAFHGVAKSADPVNVDPVDDAQYCQQVGGLVEEMAMVYSTAQGIFYGIERSFCIFNVDSGSIVIGLSTFSSEKPSIAATYIKVLPAITENSTLWKGSYANPAWNVCKNLGGAESGFAVPSSYTDDLGQSDICVFGDGSMVSAWSLIYMANHREGYDAVKAEVRAEPLFSKISRDQPHK
jgi:putative hemolysin